MPKILVAEDEKDIRDLVGFTLNLSGYEVVFAVNGAEAINLATAERPDLILMDMRMPVLTGEEAAKRLLEIEETAAIPIVFLTARDNDPQISGIISHGMDYICKPFSIEQLTTKVKSKLTEVHQ